MENTFKGTDKEWFAVNFGGYINIQDGPKYADTNILDQEKVGDDVSEANAQLIIHALPMLRRLESFVKIWPDLKGQLDFNESGLSEDYEELFKDAEELIKSATTIK